jgi:hypothetical protein
MREAEIKVQHVLDKALKEKVDRKQTLDAIEEIIKEIPYSVTNPTCALKTWAEFVIEQLHASKEQKVEASKFLKKTSSFETELVIWSRIILSKIAEESLDGKLEKRNATSAFYRAMIHAFLQSNFVDLMAAGHPFP